MDKPCFSRRCCYSCNQEILTDTDYVLEWQIREFCSLTCYEVYVAIEETLHVCAVCKNPVNEWERVKFCTRFGTDIKQFCSSTCFESFKSINSFCKLCHEVIMSFMLISEEEKFCSPFCISRYNGKGINQKYFVNENVCHVCEEVGIHNFEMLKDVQPIFFCSKKCIHQIKKQIPLMCVCSLCGCLLCSPSDFFYKQGKLHYFCSKQCGNVFLLKWTKLYGCSVCQIRKLDFDMIRVNNKGKCTYFCSLNCLQKGKSSSTEIQSLDVREELPSSKVSSSMENEFPDSGMDHPICPTVAEEDLIQNLVESFQGLDVDEDLAKTLTLLQWMATSGKVDVGVGGSKVPNRTSRSSQAYSSKTDQRVQVDLARKALLSRFGPEVIPVPFPVFVPTPVSVPFFQPEPLVIPYPVFLPIPVPLLDKHQSGLTSGKSEQNFGSEEKIIEKSTRNERPAKKKKILFSFQSKAAQVSDWEKEFISGKWKDESSREIAADVDSSCHQDQITVILPSSSKTQKNSDLVTIQEDLITPETVDLSDSYGIDVWDKFVMKIRNDVCFMRKLSNHSDNFRDLSNSDRSAYLTVFVNGLVEGKRYHPNTIIYVLLSIQKRLSKSAIIDSIFINVCYQKFKKVFYEYLQDFINQFFNLDSLIDSVRSSPHVRIREEMLWESFQLGSVSPSVLVFTVFYINTKIFKVQTLADHEAVTFKKFLKVLSNQTLSDGTPFLTKMLRYFYSKDGEKHKNFYHEVKENLLNPSRCPVKINEFYASKCPRDALLSGHFYFSPILNSCPESKIWFSSRRLSPAELQNMFNLTIMVDEIQSVFLESRS